MNSNVFTVADFFYEHFIPASFDYSKKAASLWGRIIADKFRQTRRYPPKYIPRIIRTRKGPKTIFVASYPKSFFIQFYKPVKRWMEDLSYDLSKLEEEKMMCDCKIKNLTFEL